MSSAVVPRKGGGFRLSVLISESVSLLTSSASCAGGNGNGALVGAEGPAVVYVTETEVEEKPVTGPVPENVVVETTVEMVVIGLVVVTVVTVLELWSSELSRG